MASRCPKVDSAIDASGRERGFTLIELLVVIAVIAILAAILFPIFARARESAKQAKCLSNLHELGQAMKMYGDDWGGRFPDAYEWDWHPNLWDCLSRYAKTSREVFRCPSDTGEIFIQGNPTPFWKAYGGTSFAWPGRNYRENGWPWLAGLPQDNPVPPAGMGSTSAPWVWRLPLSRRPMMYDHRPWHFFVGGNVWYNIRGFDDVVYCDGHAKPLEFQKMLAHFLSNTEPQ